MCVHVSCFFFLQNFLIEPVSFRFWFKRHLGLQHARVSRIPCIEPPKGARPQLQGLERSHGSARSQSRSRRERAASAAKRSLTHCRL